MNPKEIDLEFDKQVETLVKKGYPKLINKNDGDFKKLFEPLKEKVKKINHSATDFENGYLPFVIVVKSSLVPSDKAMSLVSKEGKNGITKLYPLNPEDFTTTADVSVPKEDIYLLVDIDRGKENINLPPSEALKIIEQKNRSPLTIDEGIAIVTLYPEFLIKNNCFSLLASRHTGDKKVPAIWINGKNQPNLGWCWYGNPHTWLGSASCSKRI